MVIVAATFGLLGMLSVVLLGLVFLCRHGIALGQSYGCTVYLSVCVSFW